MAEGDHRADPATGEPGVAPRPPRAGPAGHRGAGQRYVEAARAVLEDSGSAAVTMRAVADVAGTTATAIYRHFADKGALLDAVYQQLLSEFRSRIEAAADHPAPDPRARILATLEAYRDFGLENPGGFSLLFMEPFPARRSRYPEDFRPPRSTTFRRLVAGVEECVDSGDWGEADPVDVALLLEAQVLGLMVLFRSGRFGDDIAQFRQFFRTALGSLLRVR